MNLAGGVGWGERHEFLGLNYTSSWATFPFSATSILMSFLYCLKDTFLLNVYFYPYSHAPEFITIIVRDAHKYAE